MAFIWAISAAGKGLGKSTLSRRLCAALPKAAYAKRGHGVRKPGKPENLFFSDEELAGFLERHAETHAHIVVESNGMVRRGEGDVRIFIDGPGRLAAREDAGTLEAHAQIVVSPGADEENWAAVLKGLAAANGTADAVLEALREQREFVRYLEEGVGAATPRRIAIAEGTSVADPGVVVREGVVTIMADQAGTWSLMCTPCDVEALAIGFLYSEGVIDSIEDVTDFNYRAGEGVVGVRLERPDAGRATRNLIVTSSCGMCGARNVERFLSGERACADTLRVRPSALKAWVETMHRRQTLYTRTGGTHAAALFNSEGEMSAIAEDIGRHNALDKATGRLLLRGESPRGLGAAVSGRVSLEIVAKAVRAGIELIAAVSAPSTLAVEAAEKCNVTLCGFVRENRATVYARPGRIIGLKDGD